MSGLTPIAVPIDALVSRAGRREAVRDAWPNAPACLLATLTRVLLNDRAPADALLIIADGLDEARREAAVNGQLMTAQGLERLRDLFRKAAPIRDTQGETTC